MNDKRAKDSRSAYTSRIPHAEAVSIANDLLSKGMGVNEVAIRVGRSGSWVEMRCKLPKPKVGKRRPRQSDCIEYEPTPDEIREQCALIRAANYTTKFDGVEYWDELDLRFRKRKRIFELEGPSVDWLMRHDTIDRRRKHDADNAADPGMD